MYSEDELKQGEAYRTEWYASRQYPMSLSWNSLPTEDKVRWTKEALDPTNYEEVQ